MTRRVTPEVRESIKKDEGVRTKPYRDVVALWTVGVGHLMYDDQARLRNRSSAHPGPYREDYLLKPEDNRIWTMEEVDALLTKDLQRFELAVLRLCPGDLSDGQFGALVSFSFNVGIGALQRSTLRMKVNRGDFDGAADEFMKWTKAGGKVWPGLVKRRKHERLMFLS